jgi:hypothetical protein
MEAAQRANNITHCNRFFQGVFMRPSGSANLCYNLPIVLRCEMTNLRLTAEITEAGELKVDLPSGLPPGKVEIVIQIDDMPPTDEELAELMRVEPLTGSQIVAAGLTGGWKDANIADGAAWVEEQRRNRRERRGW